MMEIKIRMAMMKMTMMTMMKMTMKMIMKKMTMMKMMTTTTMRWIAYKHYFKCLRIVYHTILSGR